MGKTTYYGNGITSRKGDLRINGKPYTDYGYEDLEKIYNYMSNWRHDDGRESSHAKAEASKLKAQMDKLYPSYRAEQMQEAYQAMMSEYMASMSEALNKEEPAAEPLKAAQEVQSEARADTARKQLLRRGLMSTMTRYGAQGGGARVQLGA